MGLSIEMVMLCYLSIEMVMFELERPITYLTLSPILGLYGVFTE